MLPLPSVSASGVRNFVNRQVGFDEDDDIDPRAAAANEKEKRDPTEGMAFDTLCCLGHFSNVVLQWAQGADINQPDQAAGASPLMWAAYKGHLPIVRFLIDRGAKIDAQCNDGQTALLWAATGNHIEIGCALLDAGADATITDSRGYNAAIVAIQHQALAFLHLLHIRHTVDPTHRDAEGHSLLAWACYLGNVALAQYCVDVLGVVPGLLDKVKRTPLHWAAREGRTECCIYLMSIGLSPQQPDEDGLTPLQYAATRHHRAAARVLAVQEKKPLNFAVGTLTLIGSASSDRFHLYHALASISFVVLFWFASFIVPPFVVHMGTVGYIMKNMLHAFLLRTPVMNSVPRETILVEMGMPRSCVGAIRGPPDHRRRDVANVCAFFTLIGVQYLTMATIADIPPPGAYLLLTALVILCAVVCKHYAYHAVIPPGTLKDDPTLKAVERGEFASLKLTRVYDTNQHLRLPLRAFFCNEADRVFQRFDGWSQLLDCPVSKSNHRSFLLTIIFVTMQQLLLCVVCYNHFREKFCPRGITVGGSDAESSDFSLLRVLYNFAFSALPCPAPLPSQSWKDWILPTNFNTAGVWLILYSLLAFLWMGFVLLRQLSGVMRGATRAELADPFALGTNGEMVPIMKQGSSVFSDGGPTANLFLFFLGQQGERWNGVPAIPAPVAAGTVAVPLPVGE